MLPMTSRRQTLTLSLLMLALGGVAALAGDPTTQPASDDQQDLRERQSVTQHTVNIAGETIAYTATTGLLPLKQEQGADKAYTFYIAYTRNDVDDRSARPLLFCFNGGPGSSSVWLHLGAFGPRRVALPPAPRHPQTPYRLEENPFSVLDVADIVFIDPIETGFSRAVAGEDKRQFHGVREDARAVADFIRLYITRNDRWASPKLVAGESYGTTRAAVLSGLLQADMGIYLNGVVLVSSILDFGATDFGDAEARGPLLYLPTYTALAWYHEKLPERLQANLARTLAEVEAFALAEYAHALLVGDALAPPRRAEIAEQLSEYTGLPVDLVERANLRISPQLFRSSLLLDERRVVGRYDGRYTELNVEPTRPWPRGDASYAVIQGAYTAAMNIYARRDLRFISDLPYEILTGRVHPWNWEYQGGRRDSLNVAAALRDALVQQPQLEVLIVSGYYDLATPYFATDYTFDHLNLPPAYRTRIHRTYYEAGHMPYIEAAAHAKLRTDLVAFITQLAGVESAPAAEGAAE